MSAFGTTNDTGSQGTAITDFLQSPRMGVRSHDATSRSFGDVFRQARFSGTSDVEIPKAIQEKMSNMGIELDEEAMARLHEGMDQARKSGSPQAIVLVDRNAFIMDVASNVVVDVVHNGPNAVAPTRDEMMVTTNLAIVASA